MILTHFCDAIPVVDLSMKYPPEELREHGLFKPHGLWLSDERDYGWSKWCQDESFQLKNLRWAQDFEVDTTNMAVLDTDEKILEFSNKYRATPPWSTERTRHLFLYVDWAKVMQELSGVIITPYSWNLRLQVMWYYSWDCASACVWDLSKLVKKGEPYESGKHEIKQEREALAAPDEVHEKTDDEQDCHGPEKGKEIRPDEKAVL